MRVLLAWVICCLTGGLMAQSDPELLISDSLAQLAETYPDDSLVRKSALLHRAGLFAIDAGNAPRAIDLTERARKLRLRGGDELRADLVRSTYNLGTYHQELAEYRAALEYFDRVLALAPNDKEGVAHYQSARVYARRGAFAAGETAFRRAATLPPFAGDDYSLGILKMNWGGLHLDKQNRTGGEQALPLLNAALDHFAVYDDTDYERMLCLNRLGLAHTEAGQYESALATLLEAESLATELEADDEDHNVILTNLGLTYRRLDQSTIALRYYRQGLTRELREGDKAPPNKAVAVFYNNISTAHLHEGRPDSALHYAQLALEWNPADPLGQLTYLQDKARALHATGDATTALATFRRADELLDRMRRDQLLEDTRNYWRADARKLYGEALTVAVAADDPQAAFYFMEKARARLLLDELSADRARTALPATIRERLTAAGREATNSPTALRRYRRLQDSVLNAFPDYARESVGAPPPTPDQLNDLLGDGALVQYFVDEAGSVALTWTSAAGLQLTELAPLANWQDQLAAFRQAITDPDRAFTDDAARQLYDVLIRPLHLPPGQKLTIVPDGPLYQLPFGALLTDVPQPESDYDRWPWLASMRQISYAFSTQLLAFARVQRGRGNGRTLALAPVARLENTDRLQPVGI
ncbi:MAG: CHAT domain-containing protein, partial [Bacteroidota bacterium]